MNTELLRSIYATKQARRKALIRLSINERVAIIEKLRQAGIAMKLATITAGYSVAHKAASAAPCASGASTHA